MLILDILDTINDFFKPVISFFQGIWDQIRNFLLQYMPGDVINILVFGILIAISLIVVLAIVNRK